MFHLAGKHNATTTLQQVLKYHNNCNVCDSIASPDTIAIYSFFSHTYTLGFICFIYTCLIYFINYLYNNNMVVLVKRSFLPFETFFPKNNFIIIIVLNNNIHYIYEFFLI